MRGKQAKLIVKLRATRC